MSNTDNTTLLIGTHEKLCDTARGIMRDKNQDYGATDDPFANFREFGALGILVRLSDKFSRIKTFFKKGNYQVKSESLKDTILDAINYLVILHAWVDFGESLLRDQN
jgi:hypothetical protein